MSGPRMIAADLASWADRRLLLGVYAAMSVSTERERQRLRRAGRPFVDPMSSDRPTLDELEQTGNWVVHQSALKASVLGGLAGLGGAASVPPEVAATVMAVVRLSQRLAVVYGFDPETDRGQMAQWRALQAGLEIELPDQGPMGIRVRDLPRMLVPSAPATASAAVAREVVRSAAWAVAGRITRFVPVVSSGFSVVNSRVHMHAVGQRMHAVFLRLSEGGALDPSTIEDAIEVPG